MRIVTRSTHSRVPPTYQSTHPTDVSSKTSSSKQIATNRSTCIEPRALTCHRDRDQFFEVTLRKRVVLQCHFLETFFSTPDTHPHPHTTFWKEHFLYQRRIVRAGIFGKHPNGSFWGIGSMPRSVLTFSSRIFDLCVCVCVSVGRAIKRKKMYVETNTLTKKTEQRKHIQTKNSNKNYHVTSML